MSVMRNFKERLRTIGPQQSTNLPLVPGPDPEKIKAIIDRTGYQLEVSEQSLSEMIALKETFHLRSLSVSENILQ